MLKYAKKCWSPSWGRPMEVSCFEKFEIGSILSSWRRFENFPILRITPSKGLIRFLPVDCLLWPYKPVHLGIQKCLKMLSAYYGKTYKGQMVWQIWNRIETKQLAKVWKISDAMHHVQQPNWVLAGKLPKYTLKYQCTAHPKCLKILPDYWRKA